MADTRTVWSCLETRTTIYYSTDGLTEEGDGEIAPAAPVSGLWGLGVSLGASVTRYPESVTKGVYGDSGSGWCFDAFFFLTPGRTGVVR